MRSFESPLIKQGQFHLSHDDLLSINKAVEFFSAAVNEKPSFKNYCWRAKAYKKARNFDLALDDFGRALLLSTNKRNFDILYEIGKLHSLKEKFDVARTCFTKALSGPVENMGAIYYDRCLVNLKLGNFAEVINDYLEAKNQWKFEPDFPEKFFESIHSHEYGSTKGLLEITDVDAAKKKILSEILKIDDVNLKMVILLQSLFPETFLGSLFYISQSKLGVLDIKKPSVASGSLRDIATALESLIRGKGVVVRFYAQESIVAWRNNTRLQKKLGKHFPEILASVNKGLAPEEKTEESKEVKVEKRSNLKAFTSGVGDLARSISGMLSLGSPESTEKKTERPRSSSYIHPRR